MYHLKAVDSLLIHALVNISHLLCESFEELLERKKRSCIKTLQKKTFKDYSCHFCNLVTINYFNMNLLSRQQFGTIIHFNWYKNKLFIG